MDSRGPPGPPPHHHQQHHHHHHQHHHQHPSQPPQAPPGMMIHHQANSSYPTSGPTNMPNSSNPQMITPNSSAPGGHSSSMLQNNNNNNNRFPFNSSVMTNSPAPSKPSLEPLNSPYSGDGSSGMRASGFGIDPTSSQKKKRGRPRKYSPDGGGSNIALGLAPTPISNSVGGSGGGGGGGSGGGGGGGQGDSTGTALSSEHPSKRNRGRPPGSSKKQLDALGNCGVGFTPHVILVNAGEDISSKIVAFSKEGPRTVCVLSANGSVSNVSLRQPAMSGGIVNYEGRFEIISLSGSFLFSENTGGQVRTGGLSVSLAGSDGRVLGGGVAGLLMAATPVQIIVGSFIADGKKVKYMPSVPQSHMLSFAAPPLPAPESPPSQEVSSEGSEENGSNHIDRNMGSYNSNHPIHNMQMYAQPPIAWPNSGSKMLQN